MSLEMGEFVVGLATSSVLAAVRLHQLGSLSGQGGRGEGDDGGSDRPLLPVVHQRDLAELTVSARYSTKQSLHSPPPEMARFSRQT